jgi:hypothetical protein
MSLLAAAQIGFSLFFSNKAQGRKPGAPVGAVAKRLIIGASTAAEIVFLACFQIDCDGCVKGNNRFHRILFSEWFKGGQCPPLMAYSI